MLQPTRPDLTADPDLHPDLIQDQPRCLNLAMLSQVFDCLPAAALVAGDIFCVHGGLSPKLTRPADVGGIKRPCRLLAERGDLLSDLTWSDPSSKIKGAHCPDPARLGVVVARCDGSSGTSPA